MIIIIIILIIIMTLTSFTSAIAKWKQPTDILNGCKKILLSATRKLYSLHKIIKSYKTDIDISQAKAGDKMQIKQSAYLAVMWNGISIFLDNVIKRDIELLFARSKIQVVETVVQGNGRI